MRVTIIDNNRRYWNAQKGEFGEWDEGETYQTFKVDEWDNRSLYFITDKDVQDITIIFAGDAGVMIDYVRLFIKGRESTFSLIGVFNDVMKEEKRGLAPGKDDPIEKVIYEIMPYFDSRFVLFSSVSGAAKVYKELLELIKPAGITSYIEMLEKPSIDG